MATCPPLLIAPPPTTQAAGGLFTAASFPEVPGEGNGRRWECGGIEYQPEVCGTPIGWSAVCPPAVPADKVPDLEFPLVSGLPFTVLLGVPCRLVGTSLEELERRVVSAFTYNEQRAVEEIFWTGSLGNNHLADPDCVDLTPAEGALSIVAGVGKLESHLRSNYGGTGVLHAPTGLAAFAAAMNLIVGTPPAKLVTPLGTRWAFGAGYEVNTGPDGTPAPDGEAWIYATGQVSIIRSEVFVNPDDLRYAFNTRTNEVEIFAERNYAITTECVCAAIRVSASCQC